MIDSHRSDNLVNHADATAATAWTVVWRADMPAQLICRFCCKAARCAQNKVSAAVKKRAYSARPLSGAGVFVLVAGF
jgi:hypothetical protein